MLLLSKVCKAVTPPLSRAMYSLPSSRLRSKSTASFMLVQGAEASFDAPMAKPFQVLVRS